MLRCCKAKLARSLARAAAGLPAQSLLLLLLLQLWDAVVAVLLDSRCYFNLRSKADISQLNRPRGNKKKTFKNGHISSYVHRRTETWEKS